MGSYIRDCCCCCMGRQSTALSRSPQSIYEELCRRSRPVIPDARHVNAEEARRMYLSYFDPQTVSKDGTVPRGNWKRWVSNFISINFPAEHQQSAIAELTALDYNNNVHCHPIDGHIETDDDGQYKFHMGALAACRLPNGDTQFLTWMYSESLKLKDAKMTRESRQYLEHYLRQKAVDYFNQCHAVP